MTPEDKPRFILAVSALAAGFRKELDEAAIQAYWWALEEVPLKSVETACATALRASRFLPVAAEFRDLCGGSTAARRTLDAWGAFRGALRRYGYYNSVTFDDPAINATIRSLGGWIHVSLLPLAELEKWFRKDFERVYQVYVRQPPTAEQGSALVGWHDQTNEFNGYDAKPPKLITTGITPTPAIEDKRAVPKLELKKP